MLKRLALILIVAALGGAQTPAASPPSNAGDLAKSGIDSLVTNKSVLGTTEYAAPRAAASPQPGDWIVCVRSQTASATHYFAVFIEGAAVPLVRRAVAIDRCPAETYAPLPAPQPAHKPASPRKPKHAAVP